MNWIKEKIFEKKPQSIGSNPWTGKTPLDQILVPLVLSVNSKIMTWLSWWEGFDQFLRTLIKTS
ncbi:hypothetical protein [Atribacter laminatus]|uniref:hypothetical protein n=1 Tax=Atribacter laminatus TaxID=2847778 RepID=UPI001C40556D|nr:hypothetical protein [Atribacter laminatus]